MKQIYNDTDWDAFGKPLRGQRDSLLTLRLHTKPVEHGQGPLALLVHGISARGLRYAVSEMRKLQDLNISASLIHGSIPDDPPWLPMFPECLERLTLYENLDPAGATYQRQVPSRLECVQNLLNDSSFAHLDLVTLYK